MGSRRHAVRTAVARALLFLLVPGGLLSAVTPALPVVAPAVADAGERQPTDAQVTLARQRAAALRQAEQARASDVDGALAALNVAAADSALALETYAAAAGFRRVAVAELARREAALADAEAAVDRERSALARWAREAYVDGGSLGSSPGLYTLLAGGTTDDVATHQTWLQRAGRSRTELETRLLAARADASRAADDAQQAAAVAESTAAQAEAALAARDAVLADQRRRLADLSAALATTRQALDAADRDVVDLAAARAAAGWGRGTGSGLASGTGPDAGSGAGRNVVTGPVGDCPGGDVPAYGNGQIPLSALCPLATAPDHRLRADAAHAFDRMSAAYAARFGRPVCVTDTYRSYADQVRVRAERPGLAAVPGHSNHGWGTAVDLCGGVEHFATAQHRWLRLNAPLFGWFHPAWAEPDGSLPEPWHWEFAG